MCAGFQGDVVTLTRIGVLSDTHLPASGEAFSLLADLATRYFQGVDMVLHAGDLIDVQLLAVFAPCPVHAVRGNMDRSSTGIPVRKVISAGRFRIGLMHGWGPEEGLTSRLLSEFADSRIDCLVFGHSHQPLCRKEKGILLFNPGSPTDRRLSPRATVGILEIDTDIRGTIIPVD